MYVIRSKNADEALFKCLTFMSANPEHLVFSDSRNGPVVRFNEPLTSVYEDPRSRVLFNPVRDGNPFFSVFESLWMLAGRNDTKFVGYLLKNMLNYSDDGLTLNGAYGHRWRKHFWLDQLEFVIQELTKDPNSRRAHVEMWNPAQDTELLMTTGSKDVPCNFAIDFEIQDCKLNMMVSNRSNDLIWGAYGANIVHFSFLQEYIACALNVQLGTYHQVSRNAHIYLDNPVTKRLLHHERNMVHPTVEFMDAAYDSIRLNTPLYSPPLFDITREGEGLKEFEQDLDLFFKTFDKTGSLNITVPYKTDFMKCVVAPMSEAYVHYKENSLAEAYSLLTQHPEYDWLIACRQWLNRRIQQRLKDANNA